MISQSLNLFLYINNPKATDNNNEPKSISTTLNQIHRVVFHAVCCYFENYLYDETKFRQWMRVIWNIVENANIGTIQSMIGAMRLVDELSKYSDNIYKHLKDRDVSKDFAGEQMEEEKEKARQIIDDKTNIWESKIIEAEKTAFFNGAIRFLFRKGYEDYDWSVLMKDLKK